MGEVLDYPRLITAWGSKVVKRQRLALTGGFFVGRITQKGERNGGCTRREIEQTLRLGPAVVDTTSPGRRKVG